MWAHRFLKRNGFTIRNITHTGQQIKAESKKFTEDFFKIVFNTRLNIYINDNINQIGNIDECANYYENIYPTTIAKIGERNVKVRSFGKDKLRITAILTVLADGSKLQPLLIFRGKTNGPKEKSLQNNINVKKGIIYAKCQENEWTDHSLFMFGLNNIWFSNNIKKSVANSF